MKILVVCLVLIIIVMWLRSRPRPEPSESPAQRIVVDRMQVVSAAGTPQKVSSTIQSELESLAKHDVLRPDEILVEVEHAMLGWSAGAIVVTDQRVLFTSTPLVRRKPPQLVSIEFDEIRLATVTYASDGQMTLGLRITRSRAEPVDITNLSGGDARPLEIARSIEREQQRWRNRTRNGATEPPPGWPAIQIDDALRDAASAFATDEPMNDDPHWKTMRQRLVQFVEEYDRTNS